jgi:NitT/TauT family transport system substrate-binding protein
MEHTLMLNHLVKIACCALMVGIAAHADSAGGQQLIKIRIARLAFPAMSSMMLDVLKKRDIDKKYGFDLDTVSQSAVPVFYASIANGDADLIAGGPHVFQKMMLEGVRIKVVGTWAPLNVLSVITADPKIQSLADLKGKSIAAAMGSSEYQITSIYGRKLGLAFGTDVTVVSAPPPLAMAQLEAKRVDAAMLWEPTTTIALRNNPSYRVILSGDAAWKAIANARGWDLVLSARDDFLNSNGALVPRLISMFKDTEKYMQENLDDADAIVSDSLKVPGGVFKAGMQSGRLRYDVLPANGAERDVIWGMFKVAVETGYLPNLPSEDAIYSR